MLLRSYALFGEYCWTVQVLTSQRPAVNALLCRVRCTYNVCKRVIHLRIDVNTLCQPDELYHR